MRRRVLIYVELHDFPRGNTWAFLATCCPSQNADLFLMFLWWCCLVVFWLVGLQQKPWYLCTPSTGCSFCRCCFLLSRGYWRAPLASLQPSWAGLDTRHAPHLVSLLCGRPGATVFGGPVSGLGGTRFDVHHATDAQCSSTLSIPHHLRLGWCRLYLASALANVRLLCLRLLSKTCQIITPTWRMFCLSWLQILYKDVFLTGHRETAMQSFNPAVVEPSCRIPCGDQQISIQPGIFETFSPPFFALITVTSGFIASRTLSCRCLAEYRLQTVPTSGAHQLGDIWRYYDGLCAAKKIRSAVPILERVWGAGQPFASSGMRAKN